MDVPSTLLFGPVPSRRLGRSLGINNVPDHTCSYACVYCQAGPTTRMTATRAAFYEPEAIDEAVAGRLAAAAAAGERIDYLTFVPAGEPTLDLRLGESIRLLKRHGIPVAVVSNASLLWAPGVADDLAEADWVSLKVDTVREATWHRLNRPCGTLPFDRVLEGGLRFAASYRGTLTTETMLVADVNDDEREVTGVAGHVARLAPSAAYLLVPVRAPSESWVQAPAPEVVARSLAIMRQRVPVVIGLTEDEADTFSGGGDVVTALLATATVHPLRREAVQAMLAHAGAGWSVVEQLVAEGRLEREEYRGHTFYRTRAPRTGRRDEAPDTRRHT
ncbi:MAG: radical SAM protein [Vicinamibacteraceae bacterium]|nr:radical SAM protein [Vicinamibacteraceae bacterium]